MATAVRSRQQYSTYGNVAYRAGYDGGAIRAPRREEVLPPRARPRKQVLVRPRVRVREAGEVSIFAVFGFALVLGLTLLLIMNYAQLAAVHHDTVVLKNQLADLQEEETVLLAQQEMTYDLQAIEDQVTEDGSMSKPRDSQQVVLDVSEGDSVVLYQKEDNSPLAMLGRLRDNVGNLFSNVLSYFN